MSSFIAAGTAYSTHGMNMIPFFIYYSMFGFQRIGDLIWAAADIALPRLPARRHRRPHDAQRRRAAASGRPQPPARARRPERAAPTTRPTPTRSPSSSWTACGGCTTNGESIFYYLTLMNENYAMPAMPEGVARGHPARACTSFRPTAEPKAKPRAQLFGSGAILREVAQGAEASSPSSTTSPPTSGA